MADGGRRFLVVEVPGEDAERLRGELSLRPGARLVTMDRKAKNLLGSCPVCSHRFGPEKKVPISVAMAEAMISMAEKTSVWKSVIFTNKGTEKVSTQDQVRCVELDAESILHGERMGLFSSYVDGRHRNHHLTDISIKYLSGETISPGGVVILDGEIVDIDSADTNLAKLKIKDRVAHDQLISRAKDAVSKIPKSVLSFIRSGQAVLIG